MYEHDRFGELEDEGREPRVEGRATTKVGAVALGKGQVAMSIEPLKRRDVESFMR